MGHQQEHAAGGGHAPQDAGEDADERADVDERAEDGDADLLGQEAHGRGAVAETLGGGVEAEDLGVSADDEKDAREHGALNESAGDVAEGFAGLGTEAGGALEADEAKEGEDDAQADLREGDALELPLGEVEVEAVLPQNHEYDDEDEGDRDGLDPEHELRRDFDVAIGDGGGAEDGDYGQEDGIGGVTSVGDEEDVGVVDEASGNRGAGGDVGEEECPGGDESPPSGAGF